MTTNGVVIDEPTNTLTISRHYPAAPQRVWFAWTDPAALAQWWGPHGWTTTIERMDVRPGGEWLFSMAPDDGSAAPIYGRAVYDEVHAPARLSYVDAFTDADWTPIDDGIPTGVTFAPDGTGTTVTVAAVFPDGGALRQARELGMAEGLREALDRLATALP